MQLLHCAAPRKVERAGVCVGCARFGGKSQCRDAVRVGNMQRCARGNVDLRGDFAVLDFRHVALCTGRDSQRAFGLDANPRNPRPVRQRQRDAVHDHDAGRNIPRLARGNRHVACGHKVRRIGVVCNRPIIIRAENEALLAARKVVRGGVGDFDAAGEPAGVPENVLHCIGSAVQPQGSRAGKLAEYEAHVAFAADDALTAVVELDRRAIVDDQLRLADIRAC